MIATASLKALADKIIERNRLRNKCATGELRCPDYEGVKVAPEVALRSSPQPGAVRSYIEQACAGIPGITPARYEALLSEDDRDWIGSGRYDVTELRCFAHSFAAGIAKGRIRFDADGNLIEHGILDPEVAA